MTDLRPPRDNIVRAIYPGVEFRAASDGGRPKLTGHFAVFNEWTRINSSFEGTFMERIAPGAFAKAFRESTPKVLFNHGKDPELGDKLIGAISSLTEDERGARYEVDLFDGLPPLLVNGLRANAYGASFRFSVLKETVVQNPVRDSRGQYPAYNPEGLPERTIQEARVPEFGPVSFPQYLGATAGVRSMTDELVFDRLTRDPERLAQLIETTRDTALPAGADASHSEPEPPVPAPVTPDQPAPTPKQEKPVTDYVTREEKASRVTELRDAITRRATEHAGVFPPDVQAQDDADNTEHDQLVRDIAAWDGRQARLRSFVADPERTESTVAAFPSVNVIRTKSIGDIYDIAAIRGGSRSDEEYRSGLRDNAMRSLDSSSFAHSTVDQERAKEGVQEILDNHDPRKEISTRILLTGSPAYKRAFEESIQVMRPNDRLEEARAAALAVVGTTTTGGYMLPYTFDPTFIKTGAWTNINPYRQICRVQQITGSNNWQGVSVGAVPAIYETEALAVTEAGPTFARPSLTAQRASSFVSISYETLQDRPDVVSEIADLIQEGKDTLEEAQFSIGVGSTVYPLGMFVKNTFTVKETITNDTFAVADLDATEAALPIRHRRDAVWMLSRAVIRIIQGWETAYGKLFNSTLGYPAVGNIENNPGGNTGMSLLGYPVWETPSAPVTVTTDDTIVGILVAPKNYMILDRVGMNVELIQNLVDADGKPTGQRGILALWRNTARALNADAGRQININ